MVTRAEKANRMRAILRELLGERTYRWNELLDSSAKAYADKYPGEIEDMNDLKGKMGSVLSLMEDAGEMHFEANICSLVRPENDENEKQTEEKNPSAGSTADGSCVRRRSSDGPTDHCRACGSQLAGRRRFRTART